MLAMIVVNKGKGVHCVTSEDCASSPEVFISGVLEYELGISMSLLLLQYRSKVSYHRLARRVSFLSRLVSRETRRVSRETRRVSFLASALEVPMLRIRRYSKPVIKTSVSYHID